MNELKFMRETRLSHSVTVNTSKPVEFPERCVQCSEWCTTFNKIPSTRTIFYNWRMFFVLIFMGFYCYEGEIRSHISCARKLRIKYYMLPFMLLALIAIGMYSFSIAPKVDNIVAIFLLIRFVLPFVLVLIFAALMSWGQRNFFYTYSDDTTCYYFRDKQYAEEFARLNGGSLGDLATTHDPVY